MKSDRFFTSDYPPRVHTQVGLDGIDRNDMSTVLVRHLPGAGRCSVASATLYPAAAGGRFRPVDRELPPIRASPSRALVAGGRLGATWGRVYDAIVVGSAVGGGVSAFRLAEAGLARLGPRARPPLHADRLRGIAGASAAPLREDAEGQARH